MNRAIYGQGYNKIVNSDNLVIGVFSVGCKNFNTSRALYFLNKAQAESQAKAVSVNSMLSFINKKSTI